MSVSDQPAPSRTSKKVSPYRIDSAQVDAQSLPDNAHSRLGVHGQWAKGANIGFASAGYDRYPPPGRCPRVEIAEGNRTRNDSALRRGPADRHRAGTRPALSTWANLLLRAKTIELTLGNGGTAAVQLQIYDRISGAPAQRIDVAAGGTASAKVSAPHGYDVAIYSPNGLLREARGTHAALCIESWLRIAGTVTHPTLQLRVSNWSTTAISATVQGAAAGTLRVRVPARTSKVVIIDPFATKHGWYDLDVPVDGHPTFVRHFAGHLENGRSSIPG